MRLPKGGREYWHPDLGTLPLGYVAVKVQFGTSGWVDFDIVDGEKVVLLAGPDVIELPHPTGTIVLTAPVTWPLVKLIGPGSKEVVIRPAGHVDLAD